MNAKQLIEASIATRMMMDKVSDALFHHKKPANWVLQEMATALRFLSKVESSEKHIAAMYFLNRVLRLLRNEWADTDLVEGWLTMLRTYDFERYVGECARFGKPVEFL